MGPLSGAIVGAVGHSMANYMLGLTHYMIPTFIIKGLMGYTIGKIVRKNPNKKNFIVAGLAALIIVSAGYFIAEIPMYGIKTAAISLIASPVQWIMSLIASAVLLPVFKRLGIREK